MISSDAEKILIERANLEYFKKTLCDETFVSWLALDNEEIIAKSGLSFSVVHPYTQVLYGIVAYIMNMYTFPTYRKRGIGTKNGTLNKIKTEKEQT